MNQELRAAGALVGPSEKEKAVTLPASEGHAIRDLYSFCQNTVGAIFSTLNNEDILTRKWQELRGRLNTWEDGFSVVEGELDQVFVKTRDKHLREATCIILCSLARSLSIYMNLIDPKWSSEGALSGVAEVVVALAPSAKDFLEVISDNSDSEVEDLIQDINDSVESLYDLVPSTERLFLSHHDRPQQALGQRPPSVKSDTPERKLEVGVGVGNYQTNIQDKFPKICDDLAMDLAKVNWNRHVRIRKMKPPEPSSPIDTRAPIEPSTIGKDSGVGSSVRTGDVLVFDNGQILDTRSEISIASRSTIPQTTTGMASFPRPPVEKLSSEISFSCTICFKQLKGIRSKRMWEEHVLRDLQPYSCLFSNCSERNTTFYSKRLWVAHEFQHHRPQRVTMFLCRKPCKQKFRERCDMVHHIINGHLDGSVSESDVVELVDLLEVKVVPKKTMCPFCLDEIEETKVSIQRHIGTHLVEIALKALPPDIDESSDFYDGSADSCNADIFGEEGDTRPGIYNLNPPTSTAYGGPVRCPVEGCQHSTTQFPSELDYRRHALGHRNDKITCPFPHPDLALQPAFPDLASFMTHLKKEGPRGHHKAGSLSSCEFCYDGTLFLPQGLYNHLRDCDFSYNSGELRTPELVNQSSRSSNTPGRPLLPQLYARDKVEDDVYVTANHIASWGELSHAGEVFSLHGEAPRAEIEEESEKETPPLLKAVQQGREPWESYIGSLEQGATKAKVPMERWLHQPLPRSAFESLSPYPPSPDPRNWPVGEIGDSNKGNGMEDAKAPSTKTTLDSFWDAPQYNLARFLAEAYPPLEFSNLSHNSLIANSVYETSSPPVSMPAHPDRGDFTGVSEIMRPPNPALANTNTSKATARRETSTTSANSGTLSVGRVGDCNEVNEIEDTKLLPTKSTRSPRRLPQPGGRSVYSCDLCLTAHGSSGNPPITYRTKAALARHHQANHLNTRFDCPIPGCLNTGSRGIKRRDNLRAHVWNQHGIKLPHQSGTGEARGV